MLLEIWTEVLPPGWEWTPDSFVGGTHEFVVETAKCAPFDDVIVYYDGTPGVYDGIHYVGRDSFSGSDVVLACNSTPPKLGRYSVYWTSWDKARAQQYGMFDERIVLSPYHQSLFGTNSRIVPLSCWPRKFPSHRKIDGMCLYSSSPDRGSAFLESIWPRVERETGAKLYRTYDKSISEPEMELMDRQSQFWLHPGQGIELFCISAVKAQVAGCIPVVVPNMALDTTVKYGVRTTLEKYADDLIAALKNPPLVESVDFGDWYTVTKELFKNVK